MTRKGLRKHEFYLSPDVMDIILEVSSQRDVQLDKGLSQIVLEWKGGIEMKPLTTKSPELSEVEVVTGSIDRRLTNIEHAITEIITTAFSKIADAQEETVKNLDKLDAKIMAVYINTSK